MKCKPSPIFCLLVTHRLMVKKKKRCVCAHVNSQRTRCASRSRPPAQRLYGQREGLWFFIRLIIACSRSLLNPNPLCGQTRVTKDKSTLQFFLSLSRDYFQQFLLRAVAPYSTCFGPVQGRDWVKMGSDVTRIAFVICVNTLEKKLSWHFRSILSISCIVLHVSQLGS